MKLLETVSNLMKSATVLLIFIYIMNVEAKNTFSVVTFNTWLIRTEYKKHPLLDKLFSLSMVNNFLKSNIKSLYKFNIPKKYLDLSPDIDARVEILPQELVNTGADVIALQEVWSKEIRDYLIKSFSKLGYQYAVFYEKVSQKSLLGNGLLIVSRLELDTNVDFLKFKDATTWEDKFFTAKGVLKTRVKLVNGTWVDFYNTHLGAVDYNHKTKKFDSAQLAENRKQIEQLTAWLKRSNKSKGGTIIAGDFNTRPLNIYTQLVGNGGRFLNTFRKPAATYRNPDENHVYDYIFLNRGNKHLTPIHSKIVLSNKYGAFYLSDHMGIKTEFRL